MNLLSQFLGIPSSVPLIGKYWGNLDHLNLDAGTVDRNHSHRSNWQYLTDEASWLNRWSGRVLWDFTVSPRVCLAFLRDTCSKLATCQLNGIVVDIKSSSVAWVIERKQVFSTWENSISAVEHIGQCLRSRAVTMIAHPSLSGVFSGRPSPCWT